MLDPKSFTEFSHHESLKLQNKFTQCFSALPFYTWPKL